MTNRPPIKIVSSFLVPKDAIYFVPKVELIRWIAPNGDVIREEFVYWKKGGAILFNVAAPIEEK